MHLPAPATRRPSPLPIALLAAGVTLLGVLGVLPRWPGLLHMVALPPLDLVGDLGVLLVEAPGVPSFVAGLALSIGVRSVVLAAMLGRLDRAGIWFAARFYLAVLPLAAVPAALLYASKAVLFYALFWFGLAAALAVLLATAATPWSAPGSLRAGIAAAARRGLRAGTLGAYLLGLTMLGVLADVGGDAAAVALVPASAALTYLAAWFLLGDPGHVLVRRLLATVPAAGVAALVLVVATGPAGAPEGTALDEPRPGSVMLMSGADSASGDGAVLELDPTVLGWTCDRTYYFSYAGPGDGQPQGAARCQITTGAPYEEQDSFRSRAELVPFIEAQVAQMEPPAVVLGHSQGVWLVWEAAADGRLGGVDAIVLIGAFPENPVHFPSRGERQPGRVGRLLLEVLHGAPTGVTALTPDMPLAREWLGHPDAIEETLARPLPEGLRALSVTSTFDLPLIPGGHRVAGAVDACPVATVHPNLPYARELHDAIGRFLDGETLPRCPVWRRAVGPLVRHFGVPGSR